MSINKCALYVVRTEHLRVHRNGNDFKNTNKMEEINSVTVREGMCDLQLLCKVRGKISLYN